MVQSARLFAALLPLFSTVLPAYSLTFELSSHANKRQAQHGRLAQKAKRAAPVLPAGWSSQGCYTDGAARTFTADGFQSDTMTVDSCVAYCNGKNYRYAGLEYSRECFCDNAILNGATTAASGCNMMCAGDATQTCGGSYRLNVYRNANNNGPTALASYNGWGYKGCYTDAPGTRTLTVAMAYAGQLTPQKCLDACKTQNYLYAGMEYAVECYCGNTIANGGAVATDASTCNMACAGDNTRLCGGGNRLTLYQYGLSVTSGTTTAPTTTTATSTTAASTSSAPTATATGPSTLPSYGQWTSRGCYVDSVAQRALPVGMGVAGGAAAMTVQKCLDACHAANYNFAGLEYAGECYCGSAMAPTAATDGRCNMVCNGDNLHYCGGPNGLNVYSYATTTGTATGTTATTSSTSSAPTTTATGPSHLQAYGNWQIQGCWSDDAAARSLPVAQDLNGITTPQRCMDACYNAGYSYAGMEYAAECFCGNAVGGSIQSYDGCNMVCNGDATHYCGGPNRLELYKYNGVVPPGGGGGGGGVGPVTTGLPGTWHYAACYVDNANGRIMAYGRGPTATNTIQNCISYCTAAGFTVAGTEFSNECYCGNALANGAAVAGADGQCNMACAGDTAHACGGANRVSVYTSSTTVTVYPVPTAKTTGLVGQYVHQGCYAEPGGGNWVFKYKIEDAQATTVNGCLTKCSTYGYAAAGLEFGQECWCGDVAEVTAGGAVKAPDGDCTIPCSGTPTDLCGGVQRFNYYAWTSTANPLYVWNTPTNKGRYELLIGGIVIPLITTLGLNNKVNFLEKYGTGAPNSTGAYELDYTLANDYKKAWREMHVSSDVFCAANLVLPDRKGRVLSIGGWSFESTEGIRLYTPSGSLGVNGTTDWEEHWDKIHLQQGRWYPGVMQMANGSIFVVGGEEGSNGPPVPSIEVLPKPAGGPTYLTMDWLQQTDPNNLYPFSFVLPNGGIFIIYYNQARTLNEVTFATTKNFPTLPGAVTAAGGRTYPLEGTAVSMPQKYPYTDPFEVMACGGSAFGLALDNCVSITPEVDGAQWVIERMPSKRVMTIMTALPDGTYFIAGGALAGVAGFGLANTPNLQAILYDPSQPRHKRFSILGTTTVPRMYHSEAILLHDGRILITGSDPQDQVNPQEYRMEVYVPPYLTDGRVQPTYTITNRDWVYNTGYTITVNLPQGPTSAMRVSLLGAVSSTHGASFGQRTIFPQVSCTGNSCTVTAPPNAHVCPPGWYQLFVLDGPTPSNSQWVRIGGDPGNLGNWPPEGFTLPGMGGI